MLVHTNAHVKNEDKDRIKREWCCYVTDWLAEWSDIDNTNTDKDSCGAYKGSTQRRRNRTYPYLEEMRTRDIDKERILIVQRSLISRHYVLSCIHLDFPHARTKCEKIFRAIVHHVTRVNCARCTSSRCLRKITLLSKQRRKIDEKFPPLRSNTA